MPLPVVLGLAAPAKGDWARLRGLQAARLYRQSAIPFAAQFVTAAYVIFLVFSYISPIALIGWGVALLASLASQFRLFQQLRDSDRRQVSHAEFRQKAIGATVVGLLWGMALIAIGLLAPTAVLLHACIAVAAVIMAHTVFLAAAPLGTMLFSSVTGLGGVLALAMAGEIVLAILAIGYFGLAAHGILNSARTALIAQISEAGEAEKDEVVSLLLREFEENEADWLWQVDTGRRVRSASPRFAFALGRKESDIEGEPLLKLISGDAWETGQFPSSLHDLADRLKHRESFSNLLVKVQIGNDHRWWELSGTPMTDDRGKYIGYRGVGSDVTEQRESSEKIAYMARYDALTGLPNRLMLNEGLAEAMRYAEQWRTRCAFLMVDLDRFKSVNDSLGHQVGDLLLAQVSARLNALMTDNETCGRLGGDEFAIVIRDASDLSRIEEVAKAVIDRLSEPYLVNNHTLYVGASVGSAICPRDGKSVEELMRNADLALYRSKGDGGGQHWPYEQALHDQAEERRQLEVSLRKVLENDELVLHFQPVVDANKETLVSFEALVRWQSPEHGFVSPVKFIPIAEETRLIVPIGTWVMEESCRQAATWPKHVKVNVNVSPEQLLEPGFAETVVRALAMSGLEPRRLEIEVTESIFLRDASVAREALEAVMALGCTVALDDFGTGYSSLGYIRKLSFSTIKVDRSFVQGASQDSAESIAIIRAVVAMAESLGMTTTAEGVESADEAKMIRDMGCTKIQGYYYGRPIPSEEALALFKADPALRA